MATVFTLRCRCSSRRILRQQLLHLGRNILAVGAACEPFGRNAHHLAHLLHRRGADFGDQGLHFGGQLLRRQLLGQKLLIYGHLGQLLRCQVRTVLFGEDRRRIGALLGELRDDFQHVGIGQFGDLRTCGLGFDDVLLGIAQCAQTHRILGLHGLHDPFRDLLFQRHSILILSLLYRLFDVFIQQEPQRVAHQPVAFRRTEDRFEGKSHDESPPLRLAGHSRRTVVLDVAHHGESLRTHGLQRIGRLDDVPVGAVFVVETVFAARKVLVRRHDPHPPTLGSPPGVERTMQHLLGECTPLARSPLRPKVRDHIGARSEQRTSVGQITPHNALQFRRKGFERGVLHTAADRRRPLFAEDEIDGRIAPERRLAALHGFQRSRTEGVARRRHGTPVQSRIVERVAADHVGLEIAPAAR